MTKLKTLQGRAAIVTGTSRGIGPYIAKSLAAEGVNLVLAARSPRELDEVAADVRTDQIRVITVPTDVADHQALRSLVAAAEREFGEVDILVNNAGFDWQIPFHRLSLDDVGRSVQVNLMAPLELTHLLLPGMLDRGRGHIVNVSSIAGYVGFPYTEAYAAKSGLIGFTRTLRADYRGSGVSASTLILGAIGGAGVGARAEQETGVKAPSFPLPHARTVGKATVRAIKRDKAEIVIFPGPGRLMKALWDFFPGMGPSMNRMAGVDGVMERIAVAREHQRDQGTAGSPAA
ncbi:MAG: SDR family NAD(P)-dependent oxidoreductase [Chloroflexi bacterium]|nr:SDR family NAD(P)-dependent oxidoreductase [Chloroflexota bacterium]